MVQAMRRLRLGRFSGAALLGLFLASACSAGSGAKSSDLHNGSAGSGLVITGSGGVGNGSGNGTGNTGNINVGNTGGTAAGMGCQHKDFTFVPKIPSVFVLVDQSGSMFDSMAWDPLKAGVLDVVMQLQGQINFGFSSFTGQQGGMCPIFSPVSPGLNNFDKISAAYSKLAKLDNPKGETPVGLVLPLVADVLKNDGIEGDKYILFVTDGEPDFCDDGDKVCPVDDVVSHLQALKAQGINTIVFGLKSTLSDISDATLQAFANAGAGQPVGSSFGTTTLQSVCYSCQGVNGWKADWAGSGRTTDCQTAGNQVLGSYADAGGTAIVYRPDAANQQALTAQIASVVSGIKTCTFDLSDFTVDLTLLNMASVSVEGQVVPLSMDNGWRMNTSSQLELVGDACSNWKMPQNNKIAFNFPCELLIPK